jgi:hypothetical protein
MEKERATLKDLHFFSNYKWPLFVLLFCCFAGAILGDSTAEALLLAHFDPHVIPTMFLVNAAFLFFLSAFLISLIDRVDRGLLFLVLSFGHGAVLFLIRASLLFHADFLYLPLFSYAYVTKILLFLMFWTLANDLVDSRRASYEFPFVAAGGTLGAIMVSFCIPTLLRIISPENLLVVWALLSVGLGCLFVPFRKVFGAAFKPAADRKVRIARSLAGVVDDIKLVNREPLLRNMAVFYFLLFFVLLNQHYTFYSQLKRHLADAKDIASFLGYFNGISMFATISLQLGVSGFVFRKIGSTRSMLFLPGILCAVFAVLSVAAVAFGLDSAQPGTAAAQFLFWAIVGGMGMRVAFFDSFFSPNFQVFFSSLPQEIRGRGKLSIEGVVKPAAIVAASVWILVAVPRLPLAANMAVLLVVSAAVVVQTFRIRSKYAQSLTAYLSGFRSKKLPSLFNLVDVPNAENFLSMLGTILEKEEYEIKKFIIEILAGMNARESVGMLVEHIDKCDSVTRATIVSMLTRLRRDDCRSTFTRLLADKDERVVANSILALAAYKDAETHEGLEVYLHHADNRIRANAVVVEWDRMNVQRQRENLLGILDRMLASEDSEEVASALFAMGEIGAPDFLPVIADFVEKNPRRAKTSMSIRHQLVIALAKMQSEQSFDLILSLSAGAHARALCDLYRGVELLVENGYPLSRCLQRIQTEHYVRRGIILKALFSRRTELAKTDCALLESVAQAEAASIYSDWLSLCILDTKGTFKEVALLRTAIYESCILEKTRNLIYIAALLDDTGLIGAVMQRLRHPNRHVRARAFEVLDNVGNSHVNRWLLSLLDSEDAMKHGRDATISFKQRSKTLVETVSEHATSSNEWLRLCALYASGALFDTTRDVRWQKLYQKGLEAAARAANASPAT